MAPAWAPDGKRLVFSRNDVLHLVDADGGHVQSLNVEGVLPSWGEPARRNRSVRHGVGAAG